MAEIQSAGGFDKLMEKLRERLAEQKGRHQGAANGLVQRAHPPLAPMDITRGRAHWQDKSRHQRAVKVWDKRD